MNGFPKDSDTHQEKHTGIYPSHIWSHIHWEQASWGNCHHLFHHSIPQISNIGFHICQARLCQNWQQDTPPNHGGSPLIHRRRPFAIKEALQLGVSEFRPHLKTPHRCSCPGRKGVSDVTPQYLCNQDIDVWVKGICWRIRQK